MQKGFHKFKKLYERLSWFQSVQLYLYFNIGIKEREKRETERGIEEMAQKIKTYALYLGSLNLITSIT